MKRVVAPNRKPRAKTENRTQQKIELNVISVFNIQVFHEYSLLFQLKPYIPSYNVLVFFINLRVAFDLNPLQFTVGNCFLHQKPIMMVKFSKKPLRIKRAYDGIIDVYENHYLLCIIIDAPIWTKQPYHYHFAHPSYGSLDTPSTLTNAKNKNIPT